MQFTENQSSIFCYRMYFQEAFNLKIEECVYVASYFWPLDDHGVSYPDTISFVGIGIMSLILVSCFDNLYLLYKNTFP